MGEAASQPKTLGRARSRSIRIASIFVYLLVGTFGRASVADITVPKSCQAVLAQESFAPNPFLPKYEGALAATLKQHPIVILGAGSNLYNGYLSIKYRLGFLFGIKDHLERGFYLYDPSFLRKTENGEVSVDVLAHRSHPHAHILSSMDQIPEHAIVIALSPNAVHEKTIEDLLRSPKVAGIYMEKPIAISEAELERLGPALSKSTIPVYFGDHYIFAGGGLFSAMGKPRSNAQDYEITMDTTGALARASFEGKSVLGRIKRIEARNLQLGLNLSDRPRLRSIKEGGGVGTDLQVHMTNVLHALGIDLQSPSFIKESVYTGSSLGRGHFVSARVAHLSNPDAAPDDRSLYGVTTDGASYDIRCGQFHSSTRNTLKLTDEQGYSLQVNFETGLTEYFDRQGKKIGEIRARADAYLATLYDALTKLSHPGHHVFQFEEQSASVREALVQ